MSTFQDFDLSKQLHYAIEDLGFTTPTPIQEQSFSVIRSGKDVVGIAQTGTGKTFAYMLPLLRDLKFSKQVNPRILVLVPTRELVIQVVEQIELFAKYINVRIVGVYGGVNMNTQAQSLQQGADIVVATPGRLYDLVLSRALQLKAIKKLVIDEVDVMLDLGFRFQITNIFELLPEQRQNIMFSATMTDDVKMLIDDFFVSPHTISIAVSGTPLDNISQTCYAVQNFYTKVNLLTHLLKDAETYSKVLVFITNKRLADRLFDSLRSDFGDDVAVIHSNKTQNYRIRSIENFNAGENRILVATDVMARGLDLDMITHVFNFNTPNYPENYMHRIGRAGRAQAKGNAVLFYKEKEKEFKEAIETLMNYEIPQLEFPEEVTISNELAPEEQTHIREHNNPSKTEGLAKGFHEKKDKNKKTNQGGSYRREIAKKYKKPKTRGDKNYNRRNKNKRR
ncbi:DEAD/DEAH box helicase [uncultured Kordia sp.]|uniref:DEAD/DEAH box helicase n=1 Tax=uncultured Kordia sp. TaxID=507699 RepID=UPI002618B01D|nr:DEAD/DEAH box helicase [uncultured Kordia sp.]